MKNIFNILLFTFLVIFAGEGFADEIKVCSNGKVTDQITCKSINSSLTAQEKEQLIAHASSSDQGKVLSEQIAGDRCGYMYKRDGTSVYSCASVGTGMTMFGMLGLLVGSFGGPAGAVIGTAVGAGVGYLLAETMY